MKGIHHAFGDVGRGENVAGIKNLHIIAVADNYDEALLLACDIVKETYENTGKTDVKSYLKSKRRK